MPTLSLRGALIAALFIHLSSACHAGILHYDDFDTYVSDVVDNGFSSFSIYDTRTPHGAGHWDIDVATDVSGVSRVNVGQSLRLKDGMALPGTGQLSLTSKLGLIPASTTGIATMSFDMLIDTSDITPAGNLYVQMMDGSDLAIVGAQRFKKKYTANQWQHVDIVLNQSGATVAGIPNGKVHFYIDGQLALVASVGADYVDGVDGFSFRLWSKSKYDWYLDNLTLRDSVHFGELFEVPHSGTVIMISSLGPLSLVLSCLALGCFVTFRFRCNR